MKRFFLFLLVTMVAGSVSAGKKTIYRNAIVLAYSPTNNVYEDDNIKLQIYDERVWITNKTEKTVFIDLSQCFMVHNGSSAPLYEREAADVKDDKKASKAKVSTSIDEYLSIAPATGSKQNETYICNLMSSGLYKTYGTTERKEADFTEYEKRFLTLVSEMVTESQNADPKGKEYVGTVTRHLTEDESIDNIGISIAYAFNKKAEEWNNVTLTTWVSDVIFAPYYIKLPKDLSKKEQRGFGVKETSPAIVHVKGDSPFEFDKDKSPITVCDWEGNFKKGTFTLNTTRVYKEKKTNILLSVFTYGMANIYNKLDGIFYKSVIYFDGSNADWGKLEYTDDKPYVESK